MNNLRAALNLRGITQKEIAKKIGVSQGNISDWIRGCGAPSNDSLQRLADALNVSTDYLLGRTDEAKPPEASTQCDKKSAASEETALSPALLDIRKKLEQLSPESLEIARAQLDLLLKSQGKRDT